MIIVPDDKKNLLKGIEFIDLFAGIGGFRYAMESFGARCVFSSEWDKHAAETYAENHGDKPHGDITKILPGDIPRHDVLCGGFPCQPFSLAGNQEGFADPRGTMFNEILKIVDHHGPRLLFLENVENISRHDGGRTMKTIRGEMERRGYKFMAEVLCASDYGIPHARKRTFMLAFRAAAIVENFMSNGGFRFPPPIATPIPLSSVLLPDPETDSCVVDTTGMDLVLKDKPVAWQNKPVQIGKIYKGRQGERIYHPSGHSITLTSGGGGIGGKTGMYLINGRVRKLAPRECARLMGLPESFKINASKTQSQRQFGNGVVVNVLQHILLAIPEAVWAKQEQAVAAQN